MGDSSDKIKSDIQDMVSKEQESHQNRLSALLKENESVTNNLKLKLDEQLSVISDKLTGTQEKIDSFHSDISSLENKVHNIETSDSKQNALLSKLEDQTDNLDVKLSSLESADLFLQEAHRMHTEKALDIEKECKRMEQTFVQFYKDQRQDIDSNIKVDINNLLIEKKNAKEAMENVLKQITSTESRLKEIEHYTQNTNETIVLNMKENLEKLENSANQRATDLENTVIKYYEQIGSNSEKIKEISSISSNLESKLKNLSDIVEENKTTQNQFESDQREKYQEINSKFENEHERLNNTETDMRISIDNLNKQYTDVDNKIVMVINDKFENLQTIISSYESKNKDTIQNIHDLADRASNMEDGIEKKFSVFNEKLTEHSNRINSLQESNTLQNQKVGNFEGLSDKVTQVEDSMKVIEENLNALMINISKNDAQQDSQIKTLEIKNRSLEDKLSSLESADLFLQESYRQLSDKTVKIESDFRKSDDNLNFLYKQQHEEIEGKIKGQITDIYFEINELQQEKIGMNEKIDEMENNMEKNKNIVGSFEKSMPEVIKKINMDMDKKVKDIQLSHENEFTKIAHSLKEENNLTNNTMDDKLKDIDVNYQQVLQKMNEDKNENENQFKVLKDESQSNTQNIINIQESLYIQSEQVKKVDAERQQSMKKEKKDVQATILGNASAIGDLKRELEKTINEMSKMNVIETRLKSSEDDIKHLDDSIDGLKRNNLLNIEERIKQNADQIKHIDDTIDGLHKTVAIFEGRHVETVEKMKEVTVLASNIRVQVSEQAQKMVEQSSNDLNQIRDQIQDIENQNGLSNQKISELDSGNQALLEKLLGLEKSIVDRMEGLDKTDDNLLTKINGLQTDNAQSLADFGKDLDNKLAQHDKNYQVEYDSIRSETHILNQHLEEVKSLHVATEKRIVEMDAGNQQLLEKLLGVEKDLDGKLQGVNDNANSLVTKLNSLDNDTKNNSQTIVNLQESIYIQTEQVKKVDAERQQAEAKNKEDMENTVSTNAKAIADLKAELGDAITKIEITLKEEQTIDNSSLIDRLTIVQDATTSNQGRIESLEKAGPESIQNLVLEIDNKLKGYDESASQKLREAEDNIQKNAQGIVSLQSTSTIESEKMLKLESLMSSST